MLRRSFFYAARKTVRHLETPLPTALRNSVWTADLQVFDYHPGVYPGTLHLFRAVQQPEGCDPDPYLGWGGLASEVLIRECPGRHGNIGLEPHVANLAEALRNALDSGVEARLDPRAAVAGGEGRVKMA
jgi:thioesterase domain-containing protein